MTEQLKVYQVCTTDGTIHEVSALYGFNNADKNCGSLIFRAPDGSSGKTAVIAEFNYGSWSWWRIKPSVPAPVTEEGDTYVDSFKEQAPERYPDDMESERRSFDYTAAQDYRP